MEPKRTSTGRIPAAGGASRKPVATLVTGRDTGGRLALLELHVMAGREPLPHLHTHEDEIIYVLEGHLTVSIDNAVHRAVAGTCLLLPRGVEHAYVVTGPEARVLTAFTPAGLEDYVHAFGDETERGDPERLVVAAARYGVTITASIPEDDASDSEGCRAANTSGVDIWEAGSREDDGPWDHRSVLCGNR